MQSDFFVLFCFKLCLLPHRKVDEDVSRWEKSYNLEMDDNAETYGQ